MPVERLRVFVDTSALLAGLCSVKGAAAEILNLAEAGLVTVVLSEQVLREFDRNVEPKFPKQAAMARTLLLKMKVELVPDPSTAQAAKFKDLIEKEDQPIVAAALAAGADYLVTWNTRDFFTPKLRAAVPFALVDPGQFLVEFRKWRASFQQA